MSRELIITPNNNFLRVCKIPKKLPSEFCFGGVEHQTGITVVNWFNAIEQNAPTTIFKDDEIDQLHDKLSKFIIGHEYFSKEFTFIAIIGDESIVDIFVINPNE